MGSALLQHRYRYIWTTPEVTDERRGWGVKLPLCNHLCRLPTSTDVSSMAALMRVERLSRMRGADISKACACPADRLSRTSLGGGGG